MLESANRYAVASQEFMTKAYKYFEEGDLVQASEKGWGAAASMVKAVAEERGRPHRHHRLLYEIVEDLVEETGDEELSVIFDQASRLHANYYENWMRRRAVRRSLAAIEQFRDKLDPLLAQER